MLRGSCNRSLPGALHIPTQTRGIACGMPRACHMCMHSTKVSQVAMLDSRLGRSALDSVRADVAYEICPGVWMRASDGTFLGDGGTVPISLRLRAIVGASPSYAAA